MRNSKSLIASVVLLLLCTGTLAAPNEPTDFAMEVVVTAQPQPGRNVGVRCTRGCDWTEQTIQCRGPEGGCRAIITGRRLDTLQAVEARQPKARPVANSPCLGLQTITDPPGTTKQHCEDINEEGATGSNCYIEQVPAADSRAFVNDVVPRSPAELAGLSPGDVIVSLNGVPVRGTMEVFNVVTSMKAGQSFDALLERDGAPITVQGRVGIRMTDDSCAVPDAKLLEAAATASPQYDYGAFRLIFDVPVGNYEFRCLAGCAAGDQGGICEATTDRFTEKITDRCTMWTYQEAGGEVNAGNGDPRHVFPETSEPN